MFKPVENSESSTRDPLEGLAMSRVQLITTRSAFDVLKGISKEDLEKITGNKLYSFEKEHNGEKYVLLTTHENGNLLEDTGEEKKYEHFQIFDQNDAPLILGGRKVIFYRSECHGDDRIAVKNPQLNIEHLCHRGVSVFIVDKNGNLLVPVRSMTKDLYPGMLDFSAAEHLKVGEDYINGIIRGSMEELAYRIPKESLIHLEGGLYSAKDQTEYANFFLHVSDTMCFELSDETESLNLIKISDLQDGTISLDALNFRRDFFPVFKRFIEKYNTRNPIY